MWEEKKSSNAWNSPYIEEGFDLFCVGEKGRNRTQGQASGTHLLILALGRQISEFEDNLIYRVCSRMASAT